MQIRTRRIRARKISRRRQSRIHSKSHNGGNGHSKVQSKGRYSIKSRHANTSFQQRQRYASEQNARQIDRYHRNLAETILRNESEHKIEEFIKELTKMVNDRPPPSNQTEAAAAAEAAASAAVTDDAFVQRVQNMVPRTFKTRGFNVKSLILAMLLVFAEGANARVQRIRVSTTALQNAWNPTDPRRPDEIWSFWKQFKFDGKRGWSLDPKANYGPPQDLDINYQHRERQRLAELREAKERKEAELQKLREADFVEL